MDCANCCLKSNQIIQCLRGEKDDLITVRLLSLLSLSNNLDLIAPPFDNPEFCSLFGASGCQVDKGFHNRCCCTVFMAALYVFLALFACHRQFGKWPPPLTVPKTYCSTRSHNTIDPPTTTTTTYSKQQRNIHRWFVLSRYDVHS